MRVGPGRGQFIDLAQIECMMPFAAPWIVAHSIDGQATDQIRQSSSGFGAAWLLSLCRRRQLDRGRGRQRCDVAKVRAAVWPRRLGIRWSPEDGPGRRTIENDIEAAIGAWTLARSPRRRWPRCRRRVSLRELRGCRLICCRSAIACHRLHPGDRPRLYRQTSATFDAVSRDRQAVSDPLTAADARPAQW